MSAVNFFGTPLKIENPLEDLASNPEPNIVKLYAHSVTDGSDIYLLMKISFNARKHKLKISLYPNDGQRNGVIAAIGKENLIIKGDKLVVSDVPSFLNPLISQFPNNDEKRLITWLFIRYGKLKSSEIPVVSTTALFIHNIFSKATKWTEELL